MTALKFLSKAHEGLLIDLRSQPVLDEAFSISKIRRGIALLVAGSSRGGENCHSCRSAEHLLCTATKWHFSTSPPTTVSLPTAPRGAGTGLRALGTHAF